MFEKTRPTREGEKGIDELELGHLVKQEIRSEENWIVEKGVKQLLCPEVMMGLKPGKKSGEPGEDQASRSQ